MIKIILSIFNYLHGMGFHRVLLMSISYFILFIAIYIQNKYILLGALLWIIVLLPLIGPPGMLVWLANAWLRYVRSNFFFNKDKVVLEVKIPRIIMKSPKAMETVFNGLMVAPKEGTFIARWWNGSVRPTYSFEIASFEGELHFYVVTRAEFKGYVESNIYAQYPDVEIIEVEDYTSGLNYDKNKMEALAIEYGLAKSDALPIKTYVDYEVDKIPSKPDQRVDPLSSVFETLANLGPGEMYWLQLVMRRDKDKRRKPGTLFTFEHRVHGEARDMMEKLYGKMVETTLPDGSKYKGATKLRPHEEEQIEALSKTLEHDGIDVGIRLLYIAKKESFKPERIAPPMVKLWREFKSGVLNSIKPTKGHPVLDYPWQDFNNIRAHHMSKKFIDAYKRRSFFYHPYIHRYSVMTPEEVATIYHYPTEETKTPGLPRIQSKKSEAPANLPI